MSETRGSCHDTYVESVEWQRDKAYARAYAAEARAEKYRMSFENEVIVRREWAMRAEKLAAALREIAASHRYCEDEWYSCPKATDGCANEDAGTECNCVARIAARALAQIEGGKK